MRIVTCLILVLIPQAACAQTPGVDIEAVEARIVELEASYGDVASDVNCEAPTLTAHRLLCGSTVLRRMSRLDDMAYVYAYENAIKSEIDHQNPPREDPFYAERDACETKACLQAALRAHTNDSLGESSSPYMTPSAPTGGRDYPHR